MARLTWPAKDPADVLDYAIVWELDEGDTIVSSAWVVTGGLVKGADTVSGLTTTVWLSAGAVGRCTAQNTITTTGGRTIERTAVIQVAEM